MNQSRPNDPKTIALRAQAAITMLRSTGLDRVKAAIVDPHHAANRFASGGRLPPVTDDIQNSIAIGQHVLDNLDNETPGSIDADQLMGLESIIVAVGRPALLIRSDTFDAPPPTWQILETYRPAIQTNCASVGRIELTGHPSLDWVGTGFMIAPGVIATNRHVVQEFARPTTSGKWVFEPGMTVRIDFAEEVDGIAAREFPIGAIIAVHSTLDVALIEVARDAAPSLQLDGGGVALARSQNAYIVGYPAIDSRRNDPVAMQSIFSNIYDVKRLQPGLLNDWAADRQAYLHDCSTLGGNSGSCLVDLASNIVVGIHFGGRYMERNWAVSMRDLAATGYLQKLAARFH